MSWLDHQSTLVNAPVAKEEKTKDIKIHMPNAPDGVFVPLGKSQIKRVYADDPGPMLIIIIDEVAELLTPTGVKSEDGKAIDALKTELVSLIQSITQLSRSAGIHMILCTQRNDASIIKGVIKNNSLALDTKLMVRRRKADGQEG